MDYCCERFRDNVEVHKVIRKTDDLPDETEWYIEGGEHIYYRPFCGAFIKGEGFGEYDKMHPPVR